MDEESHLTSMVARVRSESSLPDVSKGMSSGIDLLRHLLALAVILQHMTSASRYSLETNKTLAEWIDWVDGAVLGFFLISGFLFKPPVNLAAYCRKQAVRLLGPFFIFSVLNSVLMAVLGKATFAAGITATMKLQGCGMQLYFLPYLFLVTTTMAALSNKLEWGSFSSMGRFVFLSIVIAIAYPTNTSTGSDPSLLPLYFAAFLTGGLLGNQPDRLFRNVSLVVLCSLILAIIFHDPRFMDLAGVIAFSFFFISMTAGLSSGRLPGSGGVYLLHTPILNFAVSVLLAELAVTQELNILLSLAVTYAVALGATVFVIAYLPRLKWMLLE